MKKASFFFAIVILVSANPLLLHAQLLKSLMNRALQASGQARAAKDTSQLVKPKLDSLTATFNGMNSGNSGYNQQQKKLAVSPADSAAAIQKFKSGAGGSGISYQYLMTSTVTNIKKQKDSTFMDTLSMAITDGHNTHAEFGAIGIRTIGHADMPKYSIILYPQNKTYSLNIIDTAAMNTNSISYQVTKIGNETVDGYNCIHAKLTITSAKKQVVTEDVWTSTAVPGYANFKKMATSQNVTPKMMQAMDQAGCGGFFVKIMMQSKNYSMTMLLANVQRKTFPASMFQIPSGYVPATNANTLSRLMQGVKH